MLRLITALLFAGTVANADINFYSAQKSTYKVYKMDANEQPRIVATAFALQYKGDIFVVTNNHVCSIMGGPGRSYVKLANGPSSIMMDDYDVVTHVSMTKNSDVCIMKTRRSHPGLTPAPSPNYLYQNVTVFGYLGRSEWAMITPGRLYGSEEVMDYNGFANCKDKPPHRFSLERFICLSYDKYPLLARSRVNMATVNIGPGFSGSPVLNNFGEVIGIISRYMPPSKIYGNGDGIYYPLGYITRAIDTARFVDVSSEEFRLDMEIWNKYQGLSEALYHIRYFIDKYVLGRR